MAEFVMTTLGADYIQMGSRLAAAPQLNTDGETIEDLEL